LKDSLGESAEATLLWKEARMLYASLGVNAGVAECDERIGRHSPGHVQRGDND
jgi:hypothetical protein